MKKITNLLIVATFLFQLFPLRGEKKVVNKMDWWKEAKFGMFIHWGLYSIPAGNWKEQQTKVGDGTEWIQSLLKIPVADYKTLSESFNPTQFNADDFVLLAKEAGMKYIVLTSKHHDGFAMFKSSDPFNIVDATPYKKDVVKALADACKKYGIHFGLYYSQAQDWNHAGGIACAGHWDSAQDGSFDNYLDKVAVPQVEEILSNYNPEILWWDTPCEMTLERAAKFSPILAKYPNLIVNNRLCNSIEGDLETPEQNIPATGIPGKNWESCMTMNGTWGYSVNDNNWKSTEKLVLNLIDIVSKGGNYLLNVGPTSAGLIPNPSIERLKEVGAWIKLNGEALYGTSASPFSDINWGKATWKQEGKVTKLFLSVFDWPSDGKIGINGLSNKIKKAYPISNSKNILKIQRNDTTNIINIETVKRDKYATVIVLEIDGKPKVNKKPEINAESNIFINKLTFNIISENKNGINHYTTDGTEPTINSSVANGEISVHSKQNLIIKAQTFINGKPIAGVAVKVFKKVEPCAAYFDSKPGLNFKYYEGIWNNIPDFTTLSPVKTGTVETISLDRKNKASEYGFVFDGFIKISTADVYTFFLTSDDGSRLIIDDKLIIDNDGQHGMEEKSNAIALALGYHKISVQFFQGSGGDGLKLQWKSSGKTKSEIENSILFH